MILIKYRDIKLLVNADSDMQLFIDNKDKIVALNEAMKAFTRDLLNQSTEDVNRIDKLKEELSEFVQMTDVIGFPFNMQDAELYALDKQIEYQVLEIV